MGFTVTRQGGTTDAAFQAYSRLLRQSGVDLGKLTRVPEPGTQRRWLHVWNTQGEARKFADELTRRTGEDAWEVVPTTSPTSEGPLGPILLQLARRGDGLLFALHSLSLALIRSAFPEAVQAATNTFVSTQQWLDFQRGHGTLQNLVEQLAPNLTGLTPNQLQELGYAVIDSETDDTFVFVPPAQVTQS